MYILVTSVLVENVVTGKIPLDAVRSLGVSKSSDSAVGMSLAGYLRYADGNRCYPANLYPYLLALKWIEISRQTIV